MAALKIACCLALAIAGAAVKGNVGVGLGAGAKGNSSLKEQLSQIPNVGHVFDSLSKQQWDPDEASCRDRIFNILENVENSTLWATWVWNSIEQSPTGIFFGARYHLGNYDQCLRPPWLSTHPELRTQYCLAEIEMNKGGVKTFEQVTDPFARAEEYCLNLSNRQILAVHGIKRYRNTISWIKKDTADTMAAFKIVCCLALAIADAAVKGSVGVGLGTGAKGNSYFKEQLSQIPNVGHIFDSLSKQQWDPDEASCRDRIFNILENVENSTLWATWVWNSIEQSPTGIFFGARYHLGNYDQCLRPPWLSTHPELRTQYCLAEIEMNKGGVKTFEQVTDPFARAEEYYLNTKTKFGRSFSYIGHGVCVPAGCPTKSVEKFVKALLNTGYLHAAKDATVSIHHCEEAGTPHEYPKGFYVYIYTFAALLLLATASTYYVNEYPGAVSSNSFVNHIAKSFCLRRNWDSIVKEDKDTLRCLHGIRFLTATIIVIFHYFIFSHAASVNNALDLELEMQNTKTSVFTVHVDLSVDTFFAISGLLLGKTLSTLDISNPNTLLKTILKRYTRLIGMFAVTVFYMAYVLFHTADGPIYAKEAVSQQQACQKNWWLALLMVGNYFDITEQCHPISWYIPCDFHFYVATLVLLFLYRKNQGVGRAVATAVTVAGFLAPAVTTYANDLPAALMSTAGNVLSMENVGAETKIKVLQGYMQTHNRMGPYVAGLAVGYLMSIYQPKNYKKLWPKMASFLGAFACLNLMLAVLMVGKLCYLYHVHGLLASVYTFFNRTTFAIGVLGVIVFCSYGDVPLINSFLSWHVFAPLSRLSYGMYLIHPLVLNRSIISLRSHLKHHMFDMISGSLGAVVVSLVLSLVVWLLVEAPLINVTNRYLSTKTPENAKVEESMNGVHHSATNKSKLI